jgi:hypothetical protein
MRNWQRIIADVTDEFLQTVIFKGASKTLS